MGQEFDTEYLARFVSSMLGWRVNVVLGDHRDMQPGYLGEANYEMIRLHSSLLRNCDPILPRVFWHELGHICLHKRDMAGKEEIPQPEREKEAELFANEMLLRYGDDFVWDALRGDLRYDLERRAMSEIMQFSNSKIFARNRIVEPYQRASQGDAEVTYKGQRRTTSQPQRRTASELEAQGRRELALAAKVNNPTVAAMIRRSAQEKLGTAPANGRRSEPIGNYSSAQMEHATLNR